jgi:hypothetical protein
MLQIIARNRINLAVEFQSSWALLIALLFIIVSQISTCVNITAG